MGAYVLRRLLIVIPTLVGVSLATFLAITLAPGDPLAVFLAPASEARVQLSEEDIALLRAKYGLDQPLPVRYVRWLGAVARGNFGVRLRDNRPVATIITERLGPTLTLMGTALLLSCLIGIPLGIVSALRRYTLPDYFLTVFAFVGVSVPEFFAGIALIYLVAVRADLLPVSGMYTPGTDPSLLDRLQHLVLPATVLALAQIGTLVRYTRSCMLDVLNQDYVTTARAKGLRERTVVFSHALRNALIPLITIVALLLPGLVGGAIVVEVVFQWPGMGLVFIDAASDRDFATAMALVVLTATVVVLSNLLADILYAVANPRIRYR